MRRLIWPALVVVVIGACSSAAGGSDDPGSGSGSQTPSPSIAIPARFRDEIVTDAAQRAGVGPADVTVVSVDTRTWGDSSLGCPQPGMFYTQATVDGYQVILSAGGKTYDYRVGAGRPRLCENASS
jgi:hypothetical protein